MADPKPKLVRIRYLQMLSGPNEEHFVGSIEYVDEAVAKRYVEHEVAELAPER